MTKTKEIMDYYSFDILGEEDGYLIENIRLSVRSYDHALSANHVDDIKGAIELLEHIDAGKRFSDKVEKINIDENDLIIEIKNYCIRRWLGNFFNNDYAWKAVAIAKFFDKYITDNDMEICLQKLNPIYKISNGLMDNSNLELIKDIYEKEIKTYFNIAWNYGQVLDGVNYFLTDILSYVAAVRSDLIDQAIDMLGLEVNDDFISAVDEYYLWREFSYSSKFEQHLIKYFSDYPDDIEDLLDTDFVINPTVVKRLKQIETMHKACS